MSIIGRWRRRIEEQQQADQESERKHGIASSGTKNWVTPDDIRRLEEQKVPWLRKRRTIWR